MNQYITGTMIKKLRENRGLTQSALADRLCVSSKTVSKWETGRGYPDITMVEPLSAALGISVIELMSGSDVSNSNRAANMLKVRFHVCPICGNVITSTGEAVISCCGITLPPLEAEEADETHPASVEIVEDEYFVTIEHEMSRTHYVSFIAALSCDRVDIVRLYPEGGAQARFKISGTSSFLFCCNRHGLFRLKPHSKG